MPQEIADRPSQVRDKRVSVSLLPHEYLALRNNAAHIDAELKRNGLPPLTMSGLIRSLLNEGLESVRKKHAQQRGDSPLEMLKQ